MMSDTNLRRLSYAVFAVCVVWFAAACVFRIVNPAPPAAEASWGGSSLLVTVGFFVVVIAFPVVGVLITHRDAGNVIGWLMLAIGVVWCWTVFADGYVIYGVITAPGSVPATAAVNTTAAWSWVPAIGLMGIYVLLLFPDGRLPSRRWWPLPWLAGIVVVLDTLGILLQAGPVEGSTVPGIDNPFGVPALAGVISSLTWAVGLLPVCILASAAGLLVRFHRSRGLERQQLKWLTTTGAALAAVYAVVMAVTLPAQALGTGGSDFLEGFVLMSLVLIPVAIGVAILRYRLYDIDIVISRSVVFAVLAAFISGVYVAIVVGIGTLVGRGEEPNLVLSVVATAVVAVAFQPVRRRTRSWANRLVYGERATPYEVLARFADRMGGAYDATELLPAMARTVAQGIGAQRVDVWLATSDQFVREASWPEARESSAVDQVEALPDDRVVPVRHRGELLGALAVSMPTGQPLTPTADELLAGVAAQAGLVLRNVRLIEDLRRSRQRLVTAQDDERRRLERNLHDGAQQSLVAVALMLRLTRGQLDPARDAAVTAVLDAASQQLGSAIQELRELARGIYPAILAQRGLCPALSALAERAAVPTIVACSGTRLGDDVERALYFVAAEALADAQTHTAVTEVRVLVRVTPGVVTLDVVDDGVDSADPEDGSSQRRLVDRVAVVDGTVTVDSRRGQGTRISCAVPLRPGPVTDAQLVPVGEESP